MLFEEDHIGLIKRGQKTQTRRLWDSPQVKEGNVYIAASGMFTSHEDAECYIRVTGIRKEHLGAISPADIRAEGYEDLPAFAEAWEDINDEWDSEAEVYVVEFEFVGEDHPNPEELDA